MTSQAEQILKRLTLEEKAALCAGADMWKTQAVERLGVESIYMYDGTNGIRKPEKTDEMGLFAENLPATCFPTGSALGSSWNEELLREIGSALGVESRHLNVDLLLGPGINMKRSPLGGRNFEYYSEDPCLSGELGAAFVNGLQAEGVGASLKHFACNNQETEKMVTSSEVDERTLREIYLSAFERVVKKANPWTVMTAYNLVNGVNASENEHLLKEILREEWGFGGVVMSDWSAVDDRIAGLRIGMDLEMPGPARYNAAAIVRAVRDGELAEATLDRSVLRLLELHGKVREGRRRELKPWDRQAHHALARRAAEETIVLLKNEGDLLPLEPSGAGTVAVIGQLARIPRYQGGGSARVTPTMLDIPLDEIRRAAAGRSVEYAEGYGDKATDADRLLEESLELARRARMAIVFAGQPDGTESEGYDSDHMDLPADQVRLIREVAAVQPNCVVVLSSGTAVSMQPWADSVPAIVYGWLSGQAFGGAIANLLFGLANPSGKLSETFPVKLSDNPSYLSFGGGGGKAVYSEGPFVGYRYYDKKELAPQFPFGHGLSYTKFAYSGLEVTMTGEGATVRLRVRNIGARTGKEVVQLYVGKRQSRVIRPVRELKGFRKIGLRPGEEAEVKFALVERDFAYYDAELGSWVAEPGLYDIQVGSSSADIRLAEAAELRFRESREPELRENSLVKDWVNHPKGRDVLLRYVLEMNRHVADPVALDDGFLHFFGDIPLSKLFQLYGQDWLRDVPPESKTAEMLRALEG